MLRDGKGEGEIDPWMMADRKTERREKTTVKERKRENETNGSGCLCECINNAIKQAHLRTSHITAICLAVNLSGGFRWGVSLGTCGIGTCHLRRMTPHSPQ